MATRPSPRQVIDGYSPSLVCFAVSSMAYPVHLHPSHEIIYVSGGGGILYVGGYAVRVQDGDLIYLGPNVAHGYILEQGCTTLMANALTRFTESFTDFASETQCAFLVLRQARRCERLARLLDDIRERHRSITTDLSLRGMFGMLFDCLAEKIARAEEPPMALPPSRMDLICKYAYDQLDTDRTSMAELARQVGMSTTYLSRQFTDLFGVSFSSYGVIVRIDGARRLLSQTDLTAKEIARRCGYTSIRTFDRNFMRLAGMTPSAYRAANRGAEAADYDVADLRAPLQAFYERLLDTCPAATVTMA